MTAVDSDPFFEDSDVSPEGETRGLLHRLMVEDIHLDHPLLRYAADRAGIALDFVDAATLSEVRHSIEKQLFELVLAEPPAPAEAGAELIAEMTEGARRSEATTGLGIAADTSRNGPPEAEPGAEGKGQAPAG